MCPASVLDSSSTSAESPGEDRPDVGVLVGGGEGRRAMAVAVQQAAVTGGKVCVIRCVDTTGIRAPLERARRSAAARSQLAQLVAQYITEHDGIRITERLHVGTVTSLLKTLEPSIATVVVEAREVPAMGDALARCSARVCVVDEAGTAIPLDSAADDGARRP